MRRPAVYTSLIAFSVCFLSLINTAQAEQWLAGSDPALSGNAAQPAQTKNEWNFTIGGGAGYGPRYEGSDNFKAFPVPVLSAEYKEGMFFATTRDGIGSYPLQDKDYKIGASLGYARGRDESDDRKNLRGMGDVDASATANLLGEYNLGLARLLAKLSTGLSGDYGTTASLKLASRYPLTDEISLTGSIGTLWADEEHMSKNFGISSRQSARSGYLRYDAGSGLKSAGFTIGANYAISEKWGLNTNFSGTQLLGDAADSPLSKNDFVPVVFIAATYRF